MTLPAWPSMAQDPLTLKPMGIWMGLVIVDFMKEALPPGMYSTTYCCTTSKNQLVSLGVRMCVLSSNVRCLF